MPSGHVHSPESKGRRDGAPRGWRSPGCKRTRTRPAVARKKGAATLAADARRLLRFAERDSLRSSRRHGIDHHQVASFKKEVVVTAGVPLAIDPRRLRGAEATRAPVLLVHGFGQNRYAWHLPLAEELLQLPRGGGLRRVQPRSARPRKVAQARRNSLTAALTATWRRTSLRRWPRCARCRAGGRCSSSVTRSAASSATPPRPRSSGSCEAWSRWAAPHFTRGSMFLGAVRAVNGGLRALRVPLGNLPLTLQPVGTALRGMTRVLKGRAHPLPLRAWHEGATEHHVLEEHFRLAFDRASLEDLRNLFDLGVGAAVRRGPRLRRAVRARRGSSRCSSSGARTTSSPHPGPSAPRTSVAAGATRPTASTRSAHRPHHGSRRSAHALARGPRLAPRARDVTRPARVAVAPAARRQRGFRSRSRRASSSSRRRTVRFRSFTSSSVASDIDLASFSTCSDVNDCTFPGRTSPA